ncbi:PHA/PHB synthase family protein [Roseateles saccharophilus]|uniref:Polyhydroxyalkanoate synthase n=1 Tax=Roseateles saccharophilus TaxID=304 RepID=A0A4R3VE42_ROSSA|nr:alpha/beta fold hydrolase [Roseateles saccharophilus]MDG0834379.1 alpha/beta fold hydrolase [Roseateles saccharophilus]TCV01982.1 polyhydroxyalkanoate synthase [Roseateles saccharophilus]
MRSPETDSPSQRLDEQFHAALARWTRSLSVVSPALALVDWAAHLGLSPGRRQELAALAQQQAAELAAYARDGWLQASGLALAGTPQPPLPDRRFAAPGWQQWPFSVMQQAFVLQEAWWAEATRDVWGVDKHHGELVAFWARQLLDMGSPANLPWSNPEVLRRTLAEGGMNFLRGAQDWVDDVQRLLTGAPPAGSEDFAVGRNLALTPGKVVWRNELMELIQYAPQTASVQAEPLLIVPAWIMKYYILDLAPGSSLIEYLVQQGHTVFAISWKNPGAEQRELGMDDYLRLGIADALRAVNAILPGRKVHGVGYCLGGTLLSIAAAAMARDGDERLASLTLFAAQTDFSEPGELGLFIDESQLSLLEAQMQQRGYLRADQMAGAFQMLRSYDLLWSRMVQEYLLGERPALNALMAWNADATRMPARMHGDYLRQLFLRNDLAEGRYLAGGRAVALSDLQLPMFVVGTETDHVAPWRSVYKLHHLCPAEIRFVLTSGGHNAGIVSPPGQGHRHFRAATAAPGQPYVAPQDWFDGTPVTEGSWWPAWGQWLADERGGPRVKPPRMGAKAAPVLGDAPGQYVLER